MKVHFEKSILQKIKSFLYKDEQFWIYLKLEDGSIHNYRYVPKNAEDGLWLNPYVINKEKQKLKEVMFINSNPRIITSQLEIIWEEIEFQDTMLIDDFFNIDEVNKNKSMYHFDYDSDQNKWSNNLAVKSETILEFQTPKKHDLIFQCDLDTVYFGNSITIELENWVKKNEDIDLNTKIVFSIRSAQKVLLWRSSYLKNQIIDEHGWNHFIYTVSYSNTITNSKLKIYLLNEDRSSYKMKDLRFRIFED